LLYSVRTVCRYRIPDLIHAGKKTAKELAEATGLHEPTLYRVVRATSAAGVVKYYDETKSFELAEAGHFLRSDHPQGMLHIFLLQTLPCRLPAISKFDEMLKTGTNCITIATGEHMFALCAKDDETREIVDKAMGHCVAGIGHNKMGEEVSIDGVKVIIDVGGGNGQMCLRLLKRKPGLKAICFDLPHVVAASTLKHDDLEFVAGDFFKPETLPQGRADAAVLCTILHDWNDDECRCILKSVRGALPAGGKLFVSDWVICPEPNFAVVLDVLIFLLFPGRERTVVEVTNLCKEAGFDFVKHYQYQEAYLASVLEFVAL